MLTIRYLQTNCSKYNYFQIKTQTQFLNQIQDQACFQKSGKQSIQRVSSQQFFKRRVYYQNYLILFTIIIQLLFLSIHPSIHPSINIQLQLLDYYRQFIIEEYSMKMFLNGEEFYYRLRDLLENSDDINNYKFNNKYHAITKDFDTFLESTVRKYVDAFHHLPLLQKEKNQLLHENQALKLKIEYFTKVLSQKNTIIKGIQQLLKEKEKIINDLQSSVVISKKSQSQHQNRSEDLCKKQQIEDLTLRLQELKEQNFKGSQIIQKLTTELQINKKSYKSKLQEYQIQNSKEILNIHKTLQQKHSKQIKELKFKNQQKILTLKDELWFLQKECKEWKQKYTKQLGFALLDENN